MKNNRLFKNTEKTSNIQKLKTELLNIQIKMLKN